MVINGLKYIFNLSFIIVHMSYRIFNNLDELLNGDLTMKIGQGILSCYLMDRASSCSSPYKFNTKCVYKFKF